MKSFLKSLKPHRSTSPPAFPVQKQPLNHDDSMMQTSSDAMSTQTQQHSTFTSTTPLPPSSSAHPNLQLIELFQSQGCNSCPPANDNVIALSSDPAYLVLTYEVTYWDHLGWKDTFARSAFDRRQRDYCRRLDRQSCFTPQVIVNGRSDGVGSTRRELNDIVRRGRDDDDGGGMGANMRSDNQSRNGSGVVSIIPAVDIGVITVSGAGAIRGIVQLVVYDSRMQDVYIKRGENGGRTLPHVNIVKEVVVVGNYKGGEQVFEIPESMQLGGDVKMAVLVQEEQGGRILGTVRC